jgi:hypothetical protein
MGPAASWHPTICVLTLLQWTAVVVSFAEIVSEEARDRDPLLASREIDSQLTAFHVGPPLHR